MSVLQVASKSAFIAATDMSVLQVASKSAFIALIPIKFTLYSSYASRAFYSSY